MSYLVDYEILDLVKHNELKIEPFDDLNIASTFVELRLGNKFTTLIENVRAHINPLELNIDEEFVNKHKYSTIDVNENDVYTLAPGEFVLAITKEKITMPKNYIGELHGRNRLGRLGVLLFCSGGFINPGFSGKLVLELYNVNQMPVQLKVNMKIAKMTIQKLNAMPHTLKIPPKLFEVDNTNK